MKLYEHQKKIIEADPKKCGLFLGTGSGKTRTALLLARGNTLVIAPKTQREDKNWERELEAIGNPVFLKVLSKEEFRRDWRTLPRFDTVIIDEAHTALGMTPNVRYVKKVPRPKSSQLFEALEEYLKNTNPDRLYLVTATIVKNPMTVFACAKLLGKDWDFYTWREAFYVRLPMPGREVFTPKKDSLSKNRLAKIVRDIGHVGRLTDYFDVPDQTYRTIHVALTEEQKKRIKELPFEYPDPLVLLGKKHQVENGVLAGDEYKEAELFSNAKIDKLIELGEEFPKMVVFVKYSAQIKQIAEAFKKEGKKVFVLEGATKNRGELITEANEQDNAVFIAQAQVSAGWELPEYPVMVFASMSYSVVDRIQGEGRILRANALKKNLYIDLVVKGGVDNAVYDAIMNKQDFNEKLYLNL